MSLLPRFLARGAALVLQYINENAKQHVRDVVKRFVGGNGGSPCPPRMHSDRNFFEAKLSSLQNYQSFDLRILEGKAAGKDLQRRAVHTDKAGSRIVYGTAQNRPENSPEEENAHSPDDTGLPAIFCIGAAADHHLRAGSPELLIDRGNVLRIVLSVAIHPDDILITQ